MKNFIKTYFSKFKIITKKRLENFLAVNEEANNFIENEIKNHLVDKFQYVQMLLHNINFKYCKKCGNELTYVQNISGNDFCSVKCMRNCEEIKEKIKNTSIYKYGVDNPSKSQKSKDKTKETCLKRYGVAHQNKCNEIRSKIIETKSKLDYKKINEKRETTNLKKYGNKNFLKIDCIREYIKTTNLRKYGSESPFGNKEIQEKARNKIYENYNVYNSFKIKHIEELTRRSRYDIAYDTILSWSEYVIPLFTREEYHGYNNLYKWKCVKCGNEFYQKIHGTFINDINERLPRCLKCHPYISGFSYSELELLNFCKKYFKSAKKDKNLIKPLELDILIEEIKLAIEFNGVFYHSIKMVENGYHLNKTKLCNGMGYRLIHIWEDEWIKDNETIKNRLKAIFENAENLNFTDDELILDRSWYNNIEIPGYILKEEVEPEIINRSGCDVENCGYLKYEKK